MGDGGGQFVISRDQRDPQGDLVRHRISRTYRRTAYSLQVLTVRNKAGVEQTLRVTEEHPFFVEFAAWTAAKSLESGDTILGADGTLAVVSNEREVQPQGVTVYIRKVRSRMRSRRRSIPASPIEVQLVVTPIRATGSRAHFTRIGVRTPRRLSEGRTLPMKDEQLPNSSPRQSRHRRSSMNILNGC